MRAALFAAAAAALCACAGLRPGPTRDGVAVRVSAREKTAARREAVETVLPLFLTDAARRDKAAALESAVLGKTGSFVGAERAAKKGPGTVEVRLGPLAAALLKAGLVRPPGYERGPELVLIALGDRTKGPDASERLAAEALETALFGRGIQAQDADDQLKKLSPPLKARTEEAAAAEAAANGWAWLAAGRAGVTARQEDQTALWKARARLSAALYASSGSTAPARFDADAEDVDVSSGSAMTRALEAAAQEGAARVEREMARRREGRATLAVYLAGQKSLAYTSQVLRDLRRVPGVEGAALVSWSDLDEMPLLHVYARGLQTDLLAARLLAGDASLRVGSIETEDGRLTLDGPETPISEDRGN